jgi:peptidoglycan/LPS O-acetylase OafA/YrhL
MPLEALRGAAALYVFLHHLRLFPNTGLGALLYFGQEAVIFFFLISGFVIDHSCRQSNMSLHRYLRHRLRRIYPIFIVSLVLSYASAAITAREWLPAEWPRLIGNLAMLQDVAALKGGVWVDTYYGNSALWSLSYEWWFYMAFIPLGLVSASLLPNRLVLVTAISVAAAVLYQLHPNQPALFASYFLIWWVGVELSREYGALGHITQKTLGKLAAILAALALIWSASLLVARGPLSLGTSPVLQVRHFAAATAILLMGAGWAKIDFKGFQTIARPFAVIAPVSYFLYVAHIPLIGLARALNLFDNPLLGTLVTFATAMVLGWVFEVQMQKRWVNRVLR